MNAITPVSIKNNYKNQLATSFKGREKQEETPTNKSSNPFNNYLAGLALIGALTLNSCERIDPFFIDPEMPINSPFKFCDTTKERVNYMFNKLGIIPENKSINDVKAVSFTDSIGNQYKWEREQDSTFIGNYIVNFKETKTTPNKEITHNIISFEDAQNHIVLKKMNEDGDVISKTRIIDTRDPNKFAETTFNDVHNPLNIIQKGNNNSIIKESVKDGTITRINNLQTTFINKDED